MSVRCSGVTIKCTVAPRWHSIGFLGNARPYAVSVRMKSPHQLDGPQIATVVGCTLMDRHLNASRIASERHSDIGLYFDLTLLFACAQTVDRRNTVKYTMIRTTVEPTLRSDE